MKKTLRKVISVLSAAAIFASIAVPCAFAENELFDKMNTATEAQIASVLQEVVTASGKLDYTILPECDKTAVETKMYDMAGGFESNEEVYVAYQKALESATRVDEDKYGTLWVEDFSNYSTANWTTTGNTKAEQVGNNEYIPYPGNPLRRYSLNITDESYSLVYGAGDVAVCGANGEYSFTRAIAEPKSIVTAYICSGNDQGGRSFSVRVSESIWIGSNGNGSTYSWANGSDMLGSEILIDTESKWHKLVFDGMAEDGKVKIYYDGTLVGTATGSIEYLQAQSWGGSGYHYLFLDNISVAVNKSVLEKPTLEQINSGIVNEGTIGEALSESDKAVFTSLPQCDRTELVKIISDNTPYTDAEAFLAAYKKAFKFTTFVNTDKYDTLWAEDFSNWDINDWQIGGALKNGSIGTEKIYEDPARQYFGNEEKASAAFMGTTDNDNNTNYIKRAVTGDNAIATVYFSDSMNQVGSYSIKVNDKTWIGKTGDEGFYKFSEGDGNVASTEVAATTGWHKVVFDSIDVPGTTKMYLDGTLVGTSQEAISYVQVGNEWNDGGWNYVWMDNISVATVNTSKLLNAFYANPSDETLETLFKWINKESAPYKALPKPDRDDIIEALLKETITDLTAFGTKYQAAYDAVFTVDTSKYDVVWTEDFKNFSEENWTVNGAPQAKAFGTEWLYDDQPRQYFGEADRASAAFVGGALTDGGPQKNYITRPVANSNSIVTAYFNDSMNDRVSQYYAVWVNDNTWIGANGVQANYSYAAGGASEATTVQKSANTWHKVVFDGLTTPGTTKMYLDGILVGTSSESIKYVKLGNDFIWEDFNIVYMDSISVVTETAEAIAERLAGYNDNPSQDALVSLMGDMGKDSGVFNSLPECDKAEIVSVLGKNTPYDTVEKLATAYQKAFETTITYDSAKYAPQWTEDFSGVLSNEWIVGGTLKGNAVGTGYLEGIGDQPRQSIGAGSEESSIGFTGTSLNNERINYIKRVIDEPKSIVTAYFYDMQTDGVGLYSVKVNDNTVIGRSGGDQYYSYKISGADFALTNVAITKAWHKVVFDGLTTPGTIYMYLDGTLVGTSTGDIEYLLLGNEYENQNYTVVWMDNVSVVTAKQDENVSIKSKGKEIEVLPTSGQVIVSLENADGTGEYAVAQYLGGKLISIEKLTGDSTVRVNATDVDKIKVFKWNSLKDMAPLKTAITCTR